MAHRAHYAHPMGHTVIEHPMIGVGYPHPMVSVYEPRPWGWGPKIGLSIILLFVVFVIIYAYASSQVENQRMLDAGNCSSALMAQQAQQIVAINGVDQLTQAQMTDAASAFAVPTAAQAAINQNAILTMPAIAAACPAGAVPNAACFSAIWDQLGCNINNNPTWYAQSTLANSQTPAGLLANAAAMVLNKAGSSTNCFGGLGTPTIPQYMAAQSVYTS